MAVWPNKNEWQKCSYEQKLIWAIRILQAELEPYTQSVNDNTIGVDSAREAIILSDFAIEDA